VPVFTTQSAATLKLRNTGRVPGYVYLVEFGPGHTTCPVAGFGDEILLQPGKSHTIPIQKFVPPYGRYLLRAFITRSPVGNELGMIVKGDERRAGTTGKLAMLDYLNSLLDEPDHTRAPGMNMAKDGASGEIVYDIAARL
jgi:hypothetical protein